MKRRLLLMPVLTGLACLSAPAVACLWDYDTLKMERQRFPEALELIAGKFLRHSKEFYQWRVQDRQQRLKETPDQLELLDDLAVAHEKLGNHQKAIEIMIRSQQISPDRYETLANLGTFYIHDGQFELGLKEIERAIKINPDAHFGREVYQKHLVNYVLSKQVDGKTMLPLDKSEREWGGPESRGFAAYVLEKAGLGHAPYAQSEELAKATKGVLGMMRFGNHDSPILLEALGDLLLSHGRRGDAKRLAARAYLKASYETQEALAKQTYRVWARDCLVMQTTSRGTENELQLTALEQTFKQELAQAESWFASVQADEQVWFKTDKNPEEEFTRKYYDSPTVISTGSSSSWQWNPFTMGLCAIVLVSLFWLCLRVRDSRRSPATQ